VRRALAALVLLAAPARADELRTSPGLELTLTVVGGGLWITSEAIFKDTLAPLRCRWCTCPGFDAGVRAALHWEQPATANLISNVSGFVLTPAAAFGLTALAAGADHRVGEWGDDALVILEAGVLAADLNQITKFLVGRERPRVHYGKPVGNDDYVSFYSGHTSFTFALAVSSGTIASLRGYKLAPVVWAGGLSLAATTGYLRIAADQHYFADVMTGAIIGSAIGFVMPWVHRHTSEPAGATTARAVGFAFRF
jgi:membrane-associated phospholipid phosphatase